MQSCVVGFVGLFVFVSDKMDKKMNSSIKLTPKYEADPSR